MNHEPLPRCSASRQTMPKPCPLHRPFLAPPLHGPTVNHMSLHHPLHCLPVPLPPQGPLANCMKCLHHAPSLTHCSAMVKPCLPMSNPASWLPSQASCPTSSAVSAPFPPPACPASGPGRFCALPMQRSALQCSSALQHVGPCRSPVRRSPVRGGDRARSPRDSSKNASLATTLLSSALFAASSHACIAPCSRIVRPTVDCTGNA